jgi:hypothetical protein
VIVPPYCGAPVAVGVTVVVCVVDVVTLVGFVVVLVAVVVPLGDVVLVVVVAVDVVLQDASNIATTKNTLHVNKITLLFIFALLFIYLLYFAHFYVKFSLSFPGSVKTTVE